MTGIDTTVFAAFAAGFISFISPCVLPLVPGYLSAVSGVSIVDMEQNDKRTTAAAVKDTVSQGAFLLAVYSAGLAIPFLVSAVAFHRATTVFRWLRDRYVVITAVSGVILITMGVLIFTGEMTSLNT